MGDSLPVIAVVGHGAGQFTDEFIRWTKEVEEDINQMITGFPSTWMSNRPPEMLDEPRALVEVIFTEGAPDESPETEAACLWAPSFKYWPSTAKYPDLQRRQLRFADIHIILDEAPDYWKDEKKAKTTICHEMLHAVFFHPTLFRSLRLTSTGVAGDHFFSGKNAIREHNKLWEGFPQYHMPEETWFSSYGVPLGRSRAHLAYEPVYRSASLNDKSDLCPVCIPGYNHGDNLHNRPMMTEGAVYPTRPNAPDTQRYNTKISRLLLAMAEDCGFTVDYSKADDHKLNLDGANANWKSCNPCPAEKLKLETYAATGPRYTETRCRVPNSNPPSYISTVNINIPKVTRTDTSTDCDFYIRFTGWIVSPRDGEGMDWKNVMETFVHVISFEKGQTVTSISVERKSEPIRLPDDWGDKPLGELGDYAVQHSQMPCFSIEELLKQGY